MSLLFICTWGADPSDLLLNFIAAPVRAYLKGRKDTVQCVVSSLGQGAHLVYVTTHGITYYHIYPTINYYQLMIII